MARLRFANPSPPSGWIEDFHLQAVDHARLPGPLVTTCGRCYQVTAYAEQSSRNRSEGVLFGQLVRYATEFRIQAAAKVIHDRDDCNCNASGDEAIIQDFHAGFAFQKLSEVFHLVSPMLAKRLRGYPLRA